VTLNTVHTAELYFAYAATRWHQSAGTLWASSVIPILILMWPNTHTRTGTHTYTFNGPVSGTTRASQYQKGKTNLNFTEARDSEWQWHQLGRMQVCTSLQTDNHASIPSLSFLQAGCPSCRQTNIAKALKAYQYTLLKSVALLSPETGASKFE